MADLKLTKEQFAKAMECQSAQELVDYCKWLGLDLPLEDAEKFISQNAESELSVDNIENVAGGVCAGALSCGCLGIGLA